MSSTREALMKPELFAQLETLVKRYGIRNVVESGTGPLSSGMELAQRLGLTGYSCDVFEPCVRDARERFPSASIYHGDSLSVFKEILPGIVGPTFFWLDGHCPTDDTCLPGGIFPPYEEMVLIKELKKGWEQDVFWLDDMSMIDVPDNPIGTSWDVTLHEGGHPIKWFGEKSHSWKEYLDFFAATHDYAIEQGECILKIEPKVVLHV